MLCCERYSIICIVVIIVVNDWFSLVDTRKKQHTRSYCLTAFFTPKKAISFLAISFEVALLKKKKKKNSCCIKLSRLMSSQL